MQFKFTVENAIKVEQRLIKVKMQNCDLKVENATLSSKMSCIEVENVTL